MARLALWFDPLKRSGPENMALDECLLEVVGRPTLRVYRWEEGWGSFGYFVKDQEAEASLVGLRRVRRWTGGGIVDHCNDWTYTLVIPRGECLAEAKGAESYRVIHEALCLALKREGQNVRMVKGAGPVKGGDCFVQAVEYDLVDELGKKVAGAGQRRNGQGLLHQGSVAGAREGSVLGRRLAANLASGVEETEVRVDEGEIRRRMAKRYGLTEWNRRR